MIVAQLARKEPAANCGAVRVIGGGRGGRGFRHTRENLLHRKPPGRKNLFDQQPTTTNCVKGKA